MSVDLLKYVQNKKLWKELSFERRVDIILESQLKFPINAGGASFGQAIHPKATFSDMKSAVKRACWDTKSATKRKSEDSHSNPPKKKKKHKFTKQQKEKIRKFQKDQLNKLSQLTRSSNKNQQTQL